MDPINPGPEGYGQDGGGTPRQRPPRESLTNDFGQSTPAAARMARLVTGDFLLTVNPVDGSEIEPCPPGGTSRSSEFGSGGEHPAGPERRTAEERAEYERAARPPVPPGPVRPEPRLLERQDERERLVRLLARGRSVRLTGPSGSGRTALLDLVADDCSDLAPDGVVRLSGFHRAPADLLHDLFHAVYKAPAHRPGPGELLDLLRGIGAVVVLDDIEFGGAGVDELLGATPECAFLIGATPDVPAPSADSAVEEVFLSGLDRAGGVDILERAVGRILTEEEANWAGDLWFESEGLPLRFVQAGALLRQRDQLRASTGAVDEFGVFASELPFDAPFDAQAAEEAPLPSLGEAAAPAPLLAARLSASARATLRFAVALDGEVPHQAHLPALVGDTHADAALGELAGCGLVSPVGPRYRLAAGVLQQLEAAGYADDVETQALVAAQHYSWWAGHPSVAAERVCAEADAVLAALSVLVPATVPPAEDEESTPVRLARTAAPAFAAGLHWSAWERALRAGAEASRLAGEVGEQAYFHHELGILALCGGHLDRARAELEASIGLRGALADKRGTTAGRRALALVADRSGEILPAVAAMAGDEIPDARHEASISPARGVTTLFPAVHSPTSDTLITHRVPERPAPARGSALVHMVRRNLVAVGSGVLLTAVLGTVVGLGMTSHDNADNPANNVSVNPSASEGTGDGSLGADPHQTSGAGGAGTATSRPTDPGPDGTLGTSDDPTPPTDTATPSASPTGTKGAGGGGTPSTPTKPSTSGPASPSSSGSASSSTPSGGGSSSSSGNPTGGSSSPGQGSSDTASPPAGTTNSASGPVSGTPSVTTSSASESSGPGTSSGTTVI